MGNLCEKDDKAVVESIKSSINIKKPQPKIQNNSFPMIEKKEEMIKQQEAPLYEKSNTQEELPPLAPVTPKKKSVGLDDFIMIGTLGKGAFGKVFKVRKRDNNKIYAMKQITKKQIIEHKLEQNTVLERNVLKQSKHPFVVQLKYSFQTPTRLYFVMECVQGGEFYKILQQTEGLPENVVKFVTAEVVLALEYLNTVLKVIYRDLKPENILLTTTGHIKLTDFGLATLKKENEEKTYTLAGTPEYLAPEIITRAGHSFEVDLWTLGILIFEMLNGKPPFEHSERNVSKIQHLILENKPVYPPQMSSDAKDLVSRILRTNPKERLGVNGYDELKQHPFFSAIRWDELYKLKLKSPLKTFAENNSLKQNTKKPNEKPIPESPTNYKCPNFAGITYNPDLGEGETLNAKRLGE